MKRLQKIFSAIGAASQILGTTVLLLIIGHFLIGPTLPDSSTRADPRQRSPVYDDFPQKARFWAEHKKAWTTHFEPYYHWRRDAFSGEFTNVGSDGVRSTTRLGESVGGRRIFMLGGSTMWGTGVPDSQTIPSFLQSLLGETYAVYNYGESGYVSAQEINYLLYQLTSGNTPDVVVFYDGVNDGYAGAYSPAIPRDPENLRVRFTELKDQADRNILVELILKSNYGKLVNHLTRKRGRHKFDEWDQKVVGSIEKSTLDVINVYESHIKQMRGLANEYGFKCFFFWQPHLFSLTRETEAFEKRIIERASPVLIRSQQEIYGIAKQRFTGREDEGIYFLGNIFDEVDGPIYIDWHHVGPRGNEIIANEMYGVLQGAL